MKNLSLLRYLYRRYRRWVWAMAALLLLIWGIRQFRGTDEPDWPTVSAFGIKMPVQYAVHGLDVSHHNRRINWQRVRAVRGSGIRLQFVFLKATEGITRQDDAFAQNWQAARRAGMRRGAYHFFHPRRDAARQADNYIRHVTLKPGDFVPVLDAEIERGLSEEDMVAGLKTWLTVVEAHYQARPMIYTNPHFYKKYIAGHFDSYPLWIADYSSKALKNYDSRRLYIWQHSQDGQVDGVPGRVDVNVFLREPDRIGEICL
jgi:lysozyme